MCGITGAAWTAEGQSLPRDALARMTAALRHRGPDDEGLRIDEGALGHRHLGGVVGAALGHRRLSIIDVAGGRQPLANEDESVWIVFNGEIYNYRDLRRRLEGSGHRFRTNSDTETLVHLYEDEGVGFLRHVEGMFALAIWDARQRQLVLARDRLGQKPLVYCEQPGRLLFASELKSLVEAPDVPREIDPSALDEYLAYQYVPHPNTIFRGIRKLPPAHYAVYRDGRLSLDRYWTPDFSHEAPRPVNEYVELVRQRMTAAVRKRLMSEVPLGAFLSGGVDSSIVVALMQEAMDQPVKTFSIGFPVPEYDETSYARQVAERLGTDHREFRVEPDAVAILPKLVWHFDEPFADSSALPTWWLSQLTREHVTVALTGDGGDELFVGYQRYRAVRLADWIDRGPAPLRTLLASSLWQRLPASPRQKSRVRQWKRFAESLAMSPGRRYFDWISIFKEGQRASLYTDEFLASLPDSDPFEFLHKAFQRSRGRDAVTAASLADLVTYLPCDLMTKVDIASMAHGLECRQPFLDHSLVELAAEMPAGLKLRGRRGKRVLLAAFGHRLPPAVPKRAKMGFGVPLDHWFRHELRDMAREVLLDPQTLGRGWFRPEAVEGLLEDHLQGSFDHSARLWSLLVFELWQREWADKPRGSPARHDACAP